MSNEDRKELTPSERRAQQEARRNPGKDRTAHESERGKKSGKSSLTGAEARKRLEDKREFGKAFLEFQNGSDRVAAIMGAALVEHELIEAIEVVLKDTTDQKALFYSAGAPFGTFSAKIIAGKALGLFDQAIADEMNFIREIRNIFAHQLLSMDFDEPAIARLVSQIGKATKSGQVLPVERAGTNRGKFEAACWSISITLIKRSTEIIKRQTEQMQKWPIGIVDDSEGSNFLTKILANKLSRK